MGSHPVFVFDFFPPPPFKFKDLQIKIGLWFEMKSLLGNERAGRLASTLL